MTSPQPPLEYPLYGATLPQAIGRFFTKYATFSGRASRSEYWWVYLFLTIITFIGFVGVAILGGATTGAREPGPGALIFGVPLMLFLLAVIVPAIALQVRRLHDANISGLLVLIGLVPQLGGVVLLILSVLPSSPAGVRYDAGAAQAVYPQGDAAPAPYPSAPSAAPGYTPAPPVQAGPPPQASPPPPVPPVDSGTP